MREPSVLLLDEATSALDSASELLINEAITSIISEGHTTVWIVAHRLSTVRAADTIMLLEDGRIAEQGTFEQLDQPGTRFRALMQSQLTAPPPAPAAVPDGKRAYSTAARRRHVPATPVWSVREATQAADTAPLLDPARLEHMHRLAALSPPATPEDMERLRAKLEPLVAVMHSTQATGGSDAVPETAWSGWRATDEAPLARSELEAGGGHWRAGYVVSSK